MMPNESQLSNFPKQMSRTLFENLKQKGLILASEARWDIFLAFFKHCARLV